MFQEPTEDIRYEVLALREFLENLTLPACEWS